MPSIPTPHSSQPDAPFTSGRWRGFWIQGPLRSRTELDLLFRDGKIRGDGADWVGDFTVRGTYDQESGAVAWTKQYRGKHSIDYAGYAEEPHGIWGRWEIEGFDKGGFQIWPDAVEGELPAAKAEAELPIDAASVMYADITAS